MSKAIAIPAGFHTVTPYLMVADVRGFIDFARAHSAPSRPNSPILATATSTPRFASATRC